MTHIEGIPGRTARVHGQDFLFFSGFAYLGMPSLPAFQALLAEGVRKAGAVYPSSRVSNTPSSLYDAFEARLSAFTGLARSASFSSGYLASQAAAAFAAAESTLLYAPGIHPSLLTAGPAFHLGIEEWPQRAVEMVNAAGDLSYTIAMESVNPLTGKRQDLGWLTGLRRQVRLLIDDSHGIGVLGEGGGGVMTMLPRDGRFRYLVAYSLSKAFSCEGGAVSGTAPDIAGLRKTPQFTASTPMSPAFVHAWMQAAALFAVQRERLAENIRYISAKIAGLAGIRQDPALPVIRIPWEGFCDYCLQHGIILSSVRYPSFSDRMLVRAVFNALHTPGDLDALAARLNEYRHKADG
jgi:7-keto-8-aminopelargonate synthetase-like enzyme